MLKKDSVYFQDLPELPYVHQQITRKTRYMPVSYVEASRDIQQLYLKDPTLATDCWLVMTLALRSTDLHKVVLFKD